MNDDLRQWVEQAAARGDVRDAVRSVYDDLETQVAARKPLCIVSGRCCHFEDYGHRLYVTTMELGAFLYEQNDNRNHESWNGKGCPFQIGKLCGVHASRPMGCRIYYCDPTSTQWQQSLYETLHARLKSLHESLGVPYAYVEWRQALKTIGLTGEREDILE